MKWVYGVTTVPERASDQLLGTLQSLASGGFDNPRIFLDGSNIIPTAILKTSNDVSLRWPRLRPAANWFLGLTELYCREPSADYYAMFQDDIAVVKNMRQYLEQRLPPTRGFANLYTIPSGGTLKINDQKAPPRDAVGWYPSNQLGRGALALVFCNDAAMKLLTDGFFLRKLVDNGVKPEHSWKYIDGGVSQTFRNLDDAARKAGQPRWLEHVHHPSLVQHVGIKSTLGNDELAKLSTAKSFPGVDFDALRLLDIKELESCE